MSSFLKHLFGSLFGKVVGGPEVIPFAALLAFAFWCLDHALIERRRRRRQAMVLVLVATALIVAVLFFPAWDPPSLARMAVYGLIIYLPLAAHTRLTARRHERREGGG